ncbi:outer membrane protein assembly factor BamE [Buchnera aphidicola (Brachycaudus cardui)]|uniref:Outer membrane protein assembly factor BamE n=1 Tax=Buchnera aphidicola (Brachycaudus cardui) TaxID=557993 RepID=A0A4D6XTD9_9GAMM|nr:outer membrane protein assembly factor BamE [Buchnera aphidicola]QCI20336.1 outer membrane protein assembly factor BamE [Buchnera aphidicola (Brachycaudus cardui)]
MENYIKILLIVVFFSGCSYLDQKKYYANNYLETKHVNQKFLNKSYIGMTKEQIIYIFGVPIISDPFDDVYHYYIYSKKDQNIFHKNMLNLYFKKNQVSSYDIQ